MESDLEEEIEMMREAMMGAADKEGLIADETLELSRKLDSLMNQFDKRKDLS
ncbi:aspartyl-phosphate phosphatase Spo0E family protein [Sporosarcina sp. FSL K6-2383]|uniref:aspartyl-phosphate phosphatase Spo0E family protein n=1 Tax=Sporosarcina sp. FSL K6-2383 TaxID=2921556 RepID=UPI00315AEE13